MGDFGFLDCSINKANDEEDYLSNYYKIREQLRKESITSSNRASTADVLSLSQISFGPSTEKPDFENRNNRVKPEESEDFENLLMKELFDADQVCACHIAMVFSIITIVRCLKMMRL